MAESVNDTPKRFSHQELEEMPCGSEMKERVQKSFMQLDVDTSKRIDKQEAAKIFTGFTKVNIQAMFEEMDENNDGQISLYEWELYFKRVLASGNYSEQDICDEIDMFLEGEGFCKFEIAPVEGVESRPSLEGGKNMKTAN